MYIYPHDLSVSVHQLQHVQITKPKMTHRSISSASTISRNTIVSKYRENHYNVMPPAIPDGWMDYKPLGRIVDGTNIICFKVPIRDQYMLLDHPESIWDLKRLFRLVPKLGAIIDLTNSYRYYKPAELKSHGIAYKKIMLQGGELPAEHKVRKFIETVDSLNSKESAVGVFNDSLIGVHCIHGVNRTGYMVCRYLRDRCHIPPKEAIKLFETARGYRIEKEYYITDLLNHMYIPDNRGPIPEPKSETYASSKRPIEIKETRSILTFKSQKSVCQIESKTKKFCKKKKMATEKVLNVVKY